MAKTPAKTVAMDEISKRRSKTLTTIVRGAIEEMIISGELTSGDRINESHLANRLEVSRGPIREACRSLEQAGLLHSVVNHGVFVREMDLEEARDLYEVRGALAGLAGRLIVARASDDDLSRLTALVDRMDDASERADFDLYYSLNLEFHGDLVRSAKNPVLERDYQAIVKQLHLFRRRGLVQQGALRTSNKEHRAIIDALLTRDADAAEAATRAHVAGGWARLSVSV